MSQSLESNQATKVPINDVIVDEKKHVNKVLSISESVEFQQFRFKFRKLKLLINSFLSGAPRVGLKGILISEIKVTLEIIKQGNFVNDNVINILNLFIDNFKHIQDEIDKEFSNKMIINHFLDNITELIDYINDEKIIHTVTPDDKAYLEIPVLSFKDPTAPYDYQITSATDLIRSEMSFVIRLEVCMHFLNDEYSRIMSQIQILEDEGIVTKRLSAWDKLKMNILVNKDIEVVHKDIITYDKLQLNKANILSMCKSLTKNSGTKPHYKNIGFITIDFLKYLEIKLVNGKSEREVETITYKIKCFSELNKLCNCLHSYYSRKVDNQTFEILK
jgi:hypothetical protein